MLPFTHINFFLTTILIIALVYFLTTNTFHFNKRHEEEKRTPNVQKLVRLHFSSLFVLVFLCFNFVHHVCVCRHMVWLYSFLFFLQQKSKKKNVFYWKWLGGNGKVSERVECIETNIIKKIIIIIVIVIHTHIHTHICIWHYIRKRDVLNMYINRENDSWQ